MSRMGGMHGDEFNGAPRASGDEPYLDIIPATDPKCSPRQRG